MFRASALPQLALASALIELLIFPSALTADAISWNGGTGNYSSTANWTCNSCPSPTFPNNGNLGRTFDATINSGFADSVLLDLTGVVVNSMSIGGSGPATPSTLNVNGNSLTLGTSSVTSGNVLAVGSGGVLNVGSGNATLELSGGAGALNDVGGQISVADGGKLILQNVNAGGVGTLVNNGSISLAGVSNPASLILNGGSGSSFTLSGTGTLTLSGMGQIAGQTGAESLINDVTHTIAGDGLISGLTSITNNGTLHATTSGAALIAGSTLSNWDNATKTLTGGSYVVENGATLQLSSIGSGNAIQNLNGATVTMDGTGLLTGGSGGNALAGLANVNQASLTLNGANLALGQAVTVSVPDAPGAGYAQLSLSASTVTFAGDLTNAATQGLNSGGQVTASNVALSSGSSLTLNNLDNFSTSMRAFKGDGAPAAVISVTGASKLSVSSLNNNATVNNPLVGAPSAIVNLTGGSSLATSGSVNNSANFAGFASSAFGVITSAAINLDGGSSLTVGGAFTNESAFGLNIASLNLTNASTATVIGPYANNNATTALQGGSTLSVGQSFSNISSTGLGTNGFSVLQLGSSSTVTVADDLNNISNGFGFDVAAASSILLDGGSRLTVNNLNNIANIGSTSDSSAVVSLAAGSALTVNGNFTNTSTPNFFSCCGTLLGSTAQITLDGGSGLTVGGAFTNTNSQLGLSLMNNSTVTVGGLFSNLNLNVQPPFSFNPALPSLVSLDPGGTGFSTLTTNGGFNEGAVNLNCNSTLANTGTFTNTGTIDLFNASKIVSSGLFDNTFGPTSTGTLTLHGGGNNITATDFNNFGFVSLGNQDTMTVTGQFSNWLAIQLNGDGASVFSSGALDNHGAIILAGKSDSVSATGTFDNHGAISLTGSGDTLSASAGVTSEGRIALTGTNGTVSIGGDFSNADSFAMITVDGTGNTLSTAGNLFNIGTIEISSGGSVTVADTFTQTAGTTSVNAGGTLTAGAIDLQGGTLTGGGAINGNLTVDGGTLNPGDPQSITINGNYDQTLLGILDLDLATPTSYDHVTVNGHANLGGTLDLTLDPNFSASIGTVFNIVSWLSETGDFAIFNDPTFNNGTETFREVFSGDHLDLLVISTTVPAVPEPSTLGMLVCALSLLVVGVGARRRYRRSARER
jgi:hypothetical protein